MTFIIEGGVHAQLAETVVAGQHPDLRLNATSVLCTFAPSSRISTDSVGRWVGGAGGGGGVGGADGVGVGRV